MSDRWNICWGKTLLGVAEVELSVHGAHIKTVIVRKNKLLSADELLRLLACRYIPSTRRNHKIFDAIMQVHLADRGSRCYGFMQTAACFAYCQSLADPLWLCPQDAAVFRMDRHTPSELRKYKIKKTEYDAISYRKNGFSEDIGKILFASPCKEAGFVSDINYNSPDLTTGGDLNKRWVEKAGVFWLQKRREWLHEEELKSAIQYRQNHYEEVAVDGYVVPEIQPIPYGWETSCLCQEGDCLLSAEQLKHIYHIYDMCEAAELIAERLGTEIPKGLRKNKDLTSGLLVTANGQLKAAYW